MNTRPLALALLVALPALAACDDDPPLGLVCTAEARAALMVRLVDANTKAGINAGATVVFVDGDWRDSATFAAGDAFLDQIYVTTERSYERPGTYTVIARRAGYVEATRPGITVTRGACHVNTRSVIIEMTPS